MEVSENDVRSVWGVAAHLPWLLVCIIRVWCVVKEAEGGEGERATSAKVVSSLRVEGDFVKVAML